MTTTVHRLTDFEASISKKTYKVDRTPYIEKYEQADESFVICLRPRGFDKRLLLSTLFYYYSEKTQKISRKLFRNLYVSSFEPVTRSSFSIFFLDFSSIQPDNPSCLKKNYETEIEFAIREYSHFESITTEPHFKTNPNQLLEDFFKSYGNEKLLVLINEYDGFHYEILDPELNQFESKKLGQNPIIRGLYAKLKEALNARRLGRIFVTATDNSQDR